MTLLVRDEVDIIRKNIDFHFAQGVDYIIATDNGSVDGTRDILAEYERLGLATIIDEPGRDYSQWKWVTRMALLAGEQYGAEWIINNDADEFWLSPSGSLSKDLTSIQANILYCNRKNMIYPYDGEADTPWYDRLIFRVSKPFVRPNLQEPLYDPLPCPYFYCNLPPKILVRSRGLKEISQGNHNAKFSQETISEESSMEIYHFPIRSREQFHLKITQGGNAYTANEELPKNMGWHWRRWNRMISAGKLTEAMAEALPSKKKLEIDVSCNLLEKDLKINALLANSF